LCGAEPRGNHGADEPISDEARSAAPRRPRGRAAPRAGQLGGDTGLLPRQEIRKLVHRSVLRATQDFDEGPVSSRPASTCAWRARPTGGGKLPPRVAETVEQQLREMPHEVVDLDEGATLEKRSVYVVELLEHLELSETIAAIANPKSSTGRLDIFTRLIADGSEMFDHVPGGYQGVSTRGVAAQFSRAREARQPAEPDPLSPPQLHAGAARGSRPDRPQLRELHARTTLVDGDLNVRHGLVLRVALDGIGPDRLVGYRARRHTSVLDVDRVGAYQVEDFWELIRARSDRRLTLDPDEFYILASKEKLHIPPDHAAEMIPIAPEMGEFRVHYAGFFDPGFGFTAQGHPAAAPCSRCAATRCRSSWRTARRSAASPSRRWPASPIRSTARPAPRTTRARS
jgi:dCTP deaminase